MENHVLHCFTQVMRLWIVTRVLTSSTNRFKGVFLIGGSPWVGSTANMLSTPRAPSRRSTSPAGLASLWQSSWWLKQRFQETNRSIGFYDELYELNTELNLKAWWPGGVFCSSYLKNGKDLNHFWKIPDSFEETFVWSTVMRTSFFEPSHIQTAGGFVTHRCQGAKVFVHSSDRRAAPANPGFGGEWNPWSVSR